MNLHPVTGLASDLGWTRQKYHHMVHKYICMVHIYAAYDNGFAIAQPVLLQNESNNKTMAACSSLRLHF